MLLEYKPVPPHVHFKIGDAPEGAVCEVAYEMNDLPREGSTPYLILDRLPMQAKVMCLNLVNNRIVHIDRRKNAVVLMATLHLER